MRDTLDPSKLRVAELRAELQARGLDTKGRKTLLAERLREALREADGHRRDAGDIKLEPDHDEQEEEEEEDPGAVHELEPDHEFKREAEHDNKPGVELEPEGDLEAEPEHHSELEPTSLPREDELSQEGLSSFLVLHADVKSLEEEDFDFSYRQHARDNTAFKEEAEDKFDKMGFEDATVHDMSEVKEELSNGYEGSFKSEEIDIKEESIEPKQEPSNKEERRGEKRRGHFRSRSPDSKSKKQRLKVEEEVIVEDEPKYDKSAVLLDWHNSDLSLLINKEDFLSAQPLTMQGFCYVWHGVRATYGFTNGRIFYEVKVLDCLPVPQLEEDEKHPHVVRVGWSIDEAGLTLGEDPFSYGYDGTGKASTNLKFKDYGKMFGKGDIVGCYLDLEAEPILMSFTVNGENQGMAYEILRSTLGERALFPHIVTKNCSFKVNFGTEEPWFTPLRYTYVGHISLQDRVLGGQGPATSEEAEASGKELKRCKKVMTLQEKVQLLDMLKEEKSYVVVARHYGMNESTVRSIKKKEAEIRKTVNVSFCGSAKQVSTVRDKTIVRMESALVNWIMGCRKKNIPLDGNTICKKALKLYQQFSTVIEVGDLQEADILGFDNPVEEEEEEEEAGPSSAPEGFRASKGWFHRFQKRFHLKCASLHGASGKELKRQKKVMTLQEKVRLLDMLKEEKSYAAVARHYSMNESTVRSIKKKEAEIRKTVNVNFCSSAKKVSTARDKTIVRMELALAEWITDSRKKNIPLDGNVIREKAQQLYQQFSIVMEGDDVQEADFLGFGEPSEEEEEEEEAGPSSAPEGFRASRGWFHRFQKRFQLKNVFLRREMVSADTEAAAKYPETFKKIIRDNGYHPEQVFNMDETGLFWKKMPSRTYLMKDEAKAPGFKAQKDRVTLIMCGNAAGFMLKPGLIYRAANPRALKNKKRHLLPVFWMYNDKACITKVLTSNWFRRSFIPQVKDYLNDVCMEFKVLLIMDNAGGHPVDLYYKGVQLEFLPANTTSLLQPMNQGVIRAFKALYTQNSLDHLVKAMDADSEFMLKGYWRKFTIATCLTIISQSLKDMKKETLNACWKNLWPESVHDHKGFSPEEIQHSAIDKAVQLARMLGGEGFDDITKDEVGTLIDTHSDPLTDQDLEELTKSANETEDTPGSGDEEEDDGLSLERLSRLMRMAKELQDLFSAWDPHMERSIKFSNGLDGLLRPYNTLLVSMKKQQQQLPITMFPKRMKKDPPKPPKTPEVVQSVDEAPAEGDEMLPEET